MKKKLAALCLCLTLLTLSGCSMNDISDFLNNAYNAPTVDNSGENSPSLTGSGNAAPQFVDTGDIEITEVEPSEIEEETYPVLLCYSVLNKQQQRIYRVMLSAVKNMTEGWINLGRCGTSYTADITVAYKAISADFPQYFWLPYTYLISNTGSNAKPSIVIAFRYKDNRNQCDYLISSAQRATMEAELNGKIAEITAAATAFSDNYEREKYVHDYLCNNITYNETIDTELVYTAYGALIQGSAVCEGYSRAMQLICRQLSIPCTLISGESEGTGHMWNLINPGDGWHHLDITWDDTAVLSYTYFNLTDNEILTDHTIAADAADLSDSDIAAGAVFNLYTAPCISETGSYFFREDMIFGADYAVRVANAIMRRRTEGYGYAQFRFADTALRTDFENNYEAYIKTIQDNINRAMGRKKIIITDIGYIADTVLLYWE